MSNHPPHKSNELVQHHGPVHTEPHGGHEGTSYEGTDASAGMVVGSLSVIGLTLVIVFALTIGIQKYIQTRNPAGELPSPLAPARVVPPAPQLQAQPWEDLPQMRAEENKVLNSSGRDAQGHYHIPINDAMNTVVSQLKVEPNAPVGLTTEGGGGRSFAHSLSDMPPQYDRLRSKEKYRSMRSKAFVLSALMLGTASLLAAQYARPKITNGVTIQQKLNAPIPLDLVFHDEANQPVALWKYFRDKPVLISLVYFNCPSLCPMSLHETVTSLRRVSLEPGRDYNVLVVSIDPKDTPREAALTKTKYKAEFGSRPGYDAGWHFLTGDQQSISTLADAVGFRYRWDKNTRQFIHAGGIMVATPDGKLSRYFYGINYAPADLRMALVDASQHKIGSPVDYILLFCFHYDPTQGRYSLAIVKLLKVAAGFTLLGLGALVFYLMRDDKNKKARTAWKEAQHVG